MVAISSDRMPNFALYSTSFAICEKVKKEGTKNVAKPAKKPSNISTKNTSGEQKQKVLAVAMEHAQSHGLPDECPKSQSRRAVEEESKQKVVREKNPKKKEWLAVKSLGEQSAAGKVVKKVTKSVTKPVKPPNIASKYMSEEQKQRVFSVAMEYAQSHGLPDGCPKSQRRRSVEELKQKVQREKNPKKKEFVAVKSSGWTQKELRQWTYCQPRRFILSLFKLRTEVKFVMLR